MKRMICCLIGACLSFPIQAEPLRLDGKTPEERGAAMVRYVASLKPDPRSETYPKGLYAVPEKVKVRNREFEYPYYKLYAPFPATGSIVKRIEKGGWVFCHNGSMLMEFQWQPHKEPYNGHLKVDGKPLVFSQEILHENPMVHQKTGGPLVIEHNGKKLTYDFEKWEKTESR